MTSLVIMTSLLSPVFCMNDNESLSQRYNSTLLI